MVDSDAPFGFPLPPATEPPDVRVRVGASPPLPADLDARAPAYAEGRHGGPADFAYHRLESWDVVRVAGCADWWLGADEIRCVLHDERCRELVPVHLFGLVLALWLERAGIPCLHGSAVEVDGGAVVVLATRRGGKSTTAAAFTAAGHPLLTDDLVALEPRDGAVLVRPGYPELRLWPEQVTALGLDPAVLPRMRSDVAKVRVPVGGAGIGGLASAPVPLRRIYLPDRGAPDAPMRLEPLAPPAALVELVRHSFLPGEVERFGWQPRRLPVLAAVVAQARVARLRYPSGLERLPELIAAVRDDLR